MLKKPRNDDIGIHKICLLLNAEYKYFAIERKYSLITLPQHCDFLAFDCAIVSLHEVFLCDTPLIVFRPCPASIFSHSVLSGQFLNYQARVTVVYRFDCKSTFHFYL